LPSHGRSAFRPARTKAERGQFDQVDRDDITGYGPAHDNRRGDRRERMPIASRRERRRHCCDVLDMIEGSTYLDRELLARING
jgi:hypothetical protein